MPRKPLVAAIAVAAFVVAGLLPSLAQPPVQPLARSAPAQSARLTFAVSAAGLRVLTIETFFSIGPDSYRIDTLSRTVGIAGFFHPGEQLASATGTWAGNRAVPNRYLTVGRWSGVPRQIVIGYDHDRPVIHDRIAPPGQRSLPIPPAMLVGASNLPSAFAEMIRDAETSGRCGTQIRAFDGRILSDVVSRSAGEVELHERAFTGPALRCDYAGHAMAGLPPDDQGNGPVPPVQRGAIWLGRIFPNYPRLPVQISFLTRWFGEVTAHLIAAQPVPAGSVAAIDPHS